MPLASPAGGSLGAKLSRAKKRCAALEEELMGDPGEEPRASAERIRNSIEGAVRYLREHPEEARGMDGPATASLEGGLKVRVQGIAGQIALTDMATAVGGEASAPSPGWLLRAALASCDATVIAMRAAQLGVALTKLEVSVDSESDDGVSSGWMIRFRPAPFGPAPGY